jgi:DNA invertase Pin-like site-specific DNA recombinase
VKYLYVRVSTVEQNEARQLEDAVKYGIPRNNIFIEKMSGKDTNRPEFQRLLQTLKSGDTLYIHDFSRLARSTADLLRIVEDLNQRNVHLVSNKENLDSSTPTGKLLLTMIGAINEFERTNLLERQAEGIAIAKREGKYKGRVSDFSTAERDEVCKQYCSGSWTMRDVLNATGIKSRATIYRWINDYEARNGIYPTGN